MLGHAALMAFVATTDGDRAKAFYSDILGLELKADEPFALVFDANGTMLRIARVQSFTPAPFTVLGWSVPDIAGSIESLAAKGVACERFSGFPQDDLAVCTFPDGTKVAWFKDADGKLLSLTQFA